MSIGSPEAESDSASPRFGPLPSQERILSLDVLRGVAIFGMLLANILIFALPSAAGTSPEGGSAAVGALKLLVGFFVEGKFYTLFAILFGMGLALQSGRAKRSGRPFVGLYARRLIVLMLIGIAHGLLFSAADILTLYAIVGFAALLLRQLRPKTLLGLAIAVYAFGLLLMGGYAAGTPDGSLPAPPDWQQLAEARSDVVEAQEVSAQAVDAERIVNLTFLPAVKQLLPITRRELYEFMADEERIFKQGTLSEMIRHRAVTYLVVGAPIKLLFLSWSTLGLFLLGMFFMKRSVLLERDVTGGIYKKLLVSGLVLGFVLQMIGGGAQSIGSSNVLVVIVAVVGLFAGIPALSLAYAGAVALVCGRWPVSALVRGVAAVGRTALSNYVGQSILCGFLFYSYGLGLFGQLSVAQAELLVFPIFALELIVSSVWLRYFRFGPLEWLWRTLSYLRLQPLRLAPATPSAC
jgi:uncharacterized protein